MLGLRPCGRRTRLRPASLVLPVVCAVAVAGSAPGPDRALAVTAARSPETLRNRQAAVKDARRRLSELRLPARAQRGSDSAAPSGWLRPLQATTVHADGAQIWRVPGTIDAVFAYVRSHIPPGSTLSGFGNDRRPGQRSYDRNLRFDWPAVLGTLGSRLLSVSIMSRGPGQSTVFAQAESQWIVARPTTERIPAVTERVAVAVSALSGHHPRQRLTISDRTKVDRVVSLFNAMEIVQPAAYSCPAFVPDQQRTLAFSFLGADSRPLAHASEVETVPLGRGSGACNPIALTIGGRPQDALSGESQMVAVETLLRISGRR